MGAGHHLERVELEVLHRAHGPLGAAQPLPAPPRPQPAAAQDKATGGLARELDQRSAA